jgi:hypothetical protein
VRGSLHVAGKVTFFVGILWLGLHIANGGFQVLWPSVTLFAGLFLAAATE